MTKKTTIAAAAAAAGALTPTGLGDLQAQRAELDKRIRQVQLKESAEAHRVAMARKAYSEICARDAFLVTAANITNGMPADAVHDALIREGNARGVAGGFDKFAAGFIVSE